MPPPGDAAPPAGYQTRWRHVSGIPVEAAFLRAYEQHGGPPLLGYPITPGLFLGDSVVQYLNHARLEMPGRSTSHPLGVPRLSELGRIMARAVSFAAATVPEPSGAFADPWFDFARRRRAGAAVGPPLEWRGVETQWFEREIVRLMPVSPAAARPVPGNLGDLYASLSPVERAHGDGRPSPLERPTLLAPMSVRAPLLTYHLTRGAEPFRRQMIALLEAGLTPISIEHLLAAIEGWAELPARPFVLSFDDGWLIQRQEALPVLLELRLPAVFFVMPGFDRFGQGHFSLEDVRAVRAAGFTVASHTLNHAQLPDLIESNLGAAEAEVVESRAILEREIDGVDFFAYPSGRFDTAAQTLVHGAGYRLALSTVPGIVHTSARRFELRRVAVQAWWPVARVRDAIRAAALVDGVDSPV